MKSQGQCEDARRRIRGTLPITPRSSQMIGFKLSGVVLASMAICSAHAKSGRAAFYSGGGTASGGGHRAKRAFRCSSNLAVCLSYRVHAPQHGSDR